MNQLLLAFAGIAILNFSDALPVRASVHASVHGYSSPWRMAAPDSQILGSVASNLPALSPDSSLSPSESDTGYSSGNVQVNYSPNLPQSLPGSFQAQMSNRAEQEFAVEGEWLQPVATPASAMIVPTVPAPPQSSQQSSQVGASRSSSVTEFATPIPADLGVQFDLSPQPSPVSGQASNQQFPTPAPSPALAPIPQPAPQLMPQSVSERAPEPAPEPTSPPVNLPTPALQSEEFTLRDLFSQDVDSLVAAAVGRAEGTRSSDGRPNQHFYGHADPGNGVWNLGTFSYQHGAKSPEEADAKQLKRLKQQSQVMQEKAAARGMYLTLEETLNGIDLANQAPLAVIDTEGYIEWLFKAHQMGKQGSDAILWARVQSFIDPQTQQWNAPGLGNTAESITHDQQRRMWAIADAIANQNDTIASDARLRAQPIGFRLPRWYGARRLFHHFTSLISQGIASAVKS